MMKAMFPFLLTSLLQFQNPGEPAKPIPVSGAVAPSQDPQVVDPIGAPDSSNGAVRQESHRAAEVVGRVEDGPDAGRQARTGEVASPPGFDATLTAALIAAAVSIASLWSSGRAEERQAIRGALAAFLPELGEGMHAALASAHIIIKRKNSDSKGDWPARGKKAKGQIEVARQRGRYLLTGLEDALQVVARAPGWAEHAKNPDFPGDCYIKAVDEVRKRVDEVVKDCFVRGRLPTKAGLRAVGSAVAVVQRVLDKRLAREDEPVVDGEV